MELAIPDCLVLGYEHLIEGLNLPDPDDRHVIAASNLFYKPKQPSAVLLALPW
jgi:hypothetical protein